MISPLRFAPFLALLPLAVGASDSALGSAAVSASPVFLSSRDIVLQVRHEKMIPECRNETGELVQSVLQELLHKGYVVHFSREYVEAERAYYRDHVTNELPAATAKAVLACLDGSLKTGVLDWECLRAAHRAAPDSAAVMRNFPWLHPRLDGSVVKLAPVSNSFPVVELTLTWEGLPVRSTVALGTPRIDGVSVSDYSPVFFGTTYLWNIPATLRVRQGGAILIERHYAAEPWKKQYVNSSDTPHYRTNQKILEDLRTSLMPAPTQAAPGKARKKAK
ncbi:MAG TPA: hypothetical protein VFA77_09645 [Candidatus Eisenbacteria bacterium]|nr:hypothetical protein [Candidatus Eisenbacteria bacterium]